VCVDAMGKLMMAYRWPLEAGISLGEYKAKVKAGFRRDGPWISLDNKFNCSSIYNRISQCNRTKGES